MKLSIITSVYRRPSELNHFFEIFAKQTSPSFELITVVDTLSDNSLEIIAHWKEKLGTKLKIIFNSKRQGRFNAIMDGLQIATGSYAMFLSTSDSFKETMVEEVLKAIVKTNSDILEFLPRFKGYLKWEPKFRHQITKKVQISAHPLLFAKTFPIDFNKVFKTKIAREAITGHAYQEINSRFAQEFLFILFTKAKTYVAIPENILISNISTKSSFNPFSILRIWKVLLKYYEINQFDVQIELFYNATYHLSIFLMKFVVATKNKAMFNKYYAKLSDLTTTKYRAHFITNKYFNQDSQEGKYVATIKAKTSYLKINREWK